MPDSQIAPKKAPLWELSLSARTKQPTIYSPFNVKDVHAIISNEYPGVDRQPEFTGYEIHPTPGNQLEIELPRPTAFNMLRWWFIAADKHRLLQLQDNFVAANWRRLDLKNANTTYPGYEAQKIEFFKFVENLRGVDKNRPEGAEFPEPDYCEISYDNFIPLIGESGERLRYRDVLNFLHPDSPSLEVLGWNVGWFQSLPDAEPGQAPEMRVLITGGVRAPIENAGPETNALRIQIIGRKPVSSWKECEAFFDRAHAACADTLFGLTTDAAHAKWKE